jgi:hypothetical protein
VPTRLIVAYSLIFLLVIAIAAVVGWKVFHSWRRTDARSRARHARADADLATKFEKGRQDG